MGDRTKIEERWWVDSKIHDIAVIMSSLETFDNVTVKALLQELNLPQKQVKTTDIEAKLLFCSNFMKVRLKVFVHFMC